MLCSGIVTFVEKRRRASNAARYTCDDFAELALEFRRTLSRDPPAVHRSPVRPGSHTSSSKVPAESAGSANLGQRSSLIFQGRVAFKNLGVHGPADRACGCRAGSS